MNTLWITNKENLEIKYGDKIVLWAHYPFNVNNAEVFSVPKELDDNFTRYKNKYLVWLSNFKNLKNNDVTLLNLFKLRADFSMWWMSLLVEKSQWKSPNLNLVFRLLALHAYLQDIKNDSINEVNLNLDDHAVQTILQTWFKKNWPEVKVTAVKRSAFNLFFKRIGLSFYKKVRLIAFMIYQFFNVITIKSAPNFPVTKSQVSIFSYFFNVDRKMLEKGRFESSYWGSLPQLLTEFDHTYNWHHIYVRHFIPGGVKRIQRFLSGINHKNTNKEYHSLIQSNLTLKLYFRSVFDAFNLRKTCNRIYAVEKHFVIDGGFNFWVLLQNDWFESFKGKVAFENCLALNSFEKLCSDLNYQRLGLYLLENQGWERALIYSWKKFGHGQLVGVQHAAMSVGDLRHYHHSSEYNSKQLQLPLPDFIGVNGNASLSLFKDSEFPEKKLLKLEALRYLYLNNISKTHESPITSGTCRLLVLGDYLPDVSIKLMDFLNDALDSLKIDLEISIKSHPAYSIELSSWPKINVNIIDAPLSQIHNQYDVALTSSSTSACLDVFFAKKPIIIMRDPEKINLSPLKYFSGVRFLSLPEELAGYLNSYNGVLEYEVSNSVNDFFYLDETLPNYREILKSISIDLT